MIELVEGDFSFPGIRVSNQTLTQQLLCQVDRPEVAELEKKSYGFFNFSALLIKERNIVGMKGGIFCVCIKTF